MIMNIQIFFSLVNTFCSLSSRKVSFVVFIFVIHTFLSFFIWYVINDDKFSSDFLHISLILIICFLLNFFIGFLLHLVSKIHILWAFMWMLLHPKQIEFLKTLYTIYSNVVQLGKFQPLLFQNIIIWILLFSFCNYNTLNFCLLVSYRMLRFLLLFIIFSSEIKVTFDFSWHFPSIYFINTFVSS